MVSGVIFVKKRVTLPALLLALLLFWLDLIRLLLRQAQCLAILLPLQKMLSIWAKLALQYLLVQ